MPAPLVGKVPEGCFVLESVVVSDRKIKVVYCVATANDLIVDI